MARPISARIAFVVITAASLSQALDQCEDCVPCYYILVMVRLRFEFIYTEHFAKIELRNSRDVLADFNHCSNGQPM